MLASRALRSCRLLKSVRYLGNEAGLSSQFSVLSSRFSVLSCGCLCEGVGCTVLGMERKFYKSVLSRTDLKRPKMAS
jgi:hypothetical protein